MGSKCPGGGADGLDRPIGPAPWVRCLRATAIQARPRRRLGQLHHGGRVCGRTLPQLMGTL